MPEYKPNPVLITGGTGTGNISQIRRNKMGSKVGKRKRLKIQTNTLKKVGALT